MTAATREDVARLFGRAAFGATKADLDRWTGKEYADVVDSLFPPSPGLPAPDDVRRTQLESATTDLGAGQRWWLERMRTAKYPLEERMTWFWHTHFATGYTGAPNVGDLMKQNQTIRLNALGSFRTLLQKLTIDGAMLYWLSGYQNKRGAVNENYARELFELFTAGVMPQTFDETDIREAAKALTGWIVKADRTVAFDQNRHDRSVKTVCGTTMGGYPAGDARNAAEYQEVCEVALNRPTTARFLAYKMVCSFAYLPATTDLVADPDPLVDAVAAALAPAWDIAAAMRTLLMHPLFRDSDEILVRQPVEYVVHLAKALTVNCDPVDGWSNTSASAHNQPIFALRRMGQTPFQPPNVGGWQEGTRWFTATTTNGRYSAGRYLLNAYNTQNRATFSPMPPSNDLAAWRAFLGLDTISPVTQQQVNAYFASPGTSDERTKQDSMLLLLAASPDWQVM